MRSPIPAIFLCNSFVTHVPSRSFRSAAFRLLGVRLDRSAGIMLHTRMLGLRSIRVGARTVVGPFCLLDGRGGLTIGSDVNVSGNTLILTAGHDVDSATFAGTTASVLIEDHSWIGTGSILLPGAHLGRGAVVGAGSVVTREVAPWTIVAGAPAKFVRKRNPDLSYELPPVGQWQ